MEKSFCSCGYGVAKYEHPKFPGKINAHILGEESCCREEVIGLNEKLTFFEGSLFNDDKKVNLVTIKGECTITEYTFRSQRGYAFHEESGVWSRPKNKTSTNSLEGDW